MEAEAMPDRGAANRARCSAGKASFKVSLPIAVAVLTWTTRAATPADPFSVPLRSIHDFLEAAPSLTANDLVKVRGVVTLHHAAGSLFLQDETGAVFVQAVTNSPVQVGDLVEAVG